MDVDTIIENVEWLTETGEPFEDIAARVDRKPESLRTLLIRRGRRDLLPEGRR